jgi:diacylglycerol kinase (ATP)
VTSNFERGIVIIGLEDIYCLGDYMKRARLIYNPSSGRELVKKQLPLILERMENAGYETSCHATTGAGDATKAAEHAVEREFDLVIAAGGDGTVYEVVNGLAEKRNRPCLGIIPAGTSNDFARGLGIPKEIEAACRILTHGQESAIDIGKVNQQYFINIAGGGTLTELTYEVPSKLKTMLGQLAYYVKGIEKLALFKPTKVRIEARERLIDEEIMLFLVANSRWIGGFEKITPEADIKDGYFDVLVVKKMSIPEFIKLATQAMRGEHLRDPRVIYFQSTELKVTSNSGAQINLDGELGGHLPCHFKVLHKHLTILTPSKD